MGNIYVGIDKLKNVYVGTSKVKKIYQDTTMIWQSAIPVIKPTNLTVTHTYTGSYLDNGYTCPSGVNMTGTASALNASTYTATYTPDEEHIWADTEDRTPVTVTMVINRASVGAKPSTSVSYDYNGSYRSPYSVPTGVTSSGTTSASAGGTYTAYYTPDSNHCWSDGTYGQVGITWYIYYVWNQYYASYTYTAASSNISVGTTVYNGGVGATVGSGYTFNSSGTYTISGAGRTWFYADQTMRQVNTTPFSSPYNVNSGLVDTFSEILTGQNSGAMIAYTTSRVWVYAATVYKRYASKSYYKGSYISQVRSTSTGSYPSNGTWDNTYWYVRTA